MRIFTVSDIHTNYSENQKWLLGLSKYDYTKDILIFAGDISHDISLIEEAFAALSQRFLDVFFVPGNHDFWVKRNQETSIERFEVLKQLADGYDIKRSHGEYDSFVIVPLLCWYDYSFGKIEKRLLSQWGDFFRCDFEGMKDAEINDYFLQQNELPQTNKTIVSFSHFLPRIDMLSKISRMAQFLAPVLGTEKLEKVVRELPARVHIYGHSHVNTYKWCENILYINNAFGYPRETHIAAKKLLDITYDVVRK